MKIRIINYFGWMTHFCVNVYPGILVKTINCFILYDVTDNQIYYINIQKKIKKKVNKKYWYCDSILSFIYKYINDQWNCQPFYINSITQFYQQQLKKLCIENKNCQSQLNQSQSQLNQSQSELNQCQSELNQCQSELNQCQSEIKPFICPYSTKSYGVRYRHFVSTDLQEEIYLGIGNLGISGCRTSMSYDYIPYTCYIFTFSYDGTNLNQTIMKDDGSNEVLLAYLNVLSTDADAFEITLANRDFGGNVYIDNIELIIGSNTYPITDNGNPQFHVTNRYVGTWFFKYPELPVTSFTFTGKFCLSGIFTTSAELSRFEIQLLKCRPTYTPNSCQVRSYET